MNDRLWSTRNAPASRSARPPKGSSSNPKVAASTAIAIELMVKSRRWRSRRIELCSTTGRRGRVLVVLRARGGHVDPQFTGDHDRSVEALVRVHATAQLGGECLGEGDPISLDRQIDVEAGSTQEQVSHRSAHQVDAVHDGRCHPHRRPQR